MREYRFQATDDTIEALRRLRAAWQSFNTTELTCTIGLANGDVVRIEVDTVDVEGVFDAYRISARLLHGEERDQHTALLQQGAMVHVTQRNGKGTATVTGTASLPAPSLANGVNDVVLFSGVSWSEPTGSPIAPGLSPDAVLLFSGHIGQLTPTAEIVCITTDAFVVASESGEGLLIRTGLKPESIEVVSNADEVRTFLVQRGYGQEEP